MHVWLLDPETSIRRLEPRYDTIVYSDRDIIFSLEPWTYKDMVDGYDITFKRLGRAGDELSLLNPEFYQALIESHKDHLLGFVLHPSWSNVIDYFKTIPGVRFEHIG